MNVQDLLTKAIRAAASAKILLDNGDTDGACNRAYYAMFDAARAALIASNAAVNPEFVRTHNSLISAFSLHLVKPGRIPVELLYSRTLKDKHHPAFDRRVEEPVPWVQMKGKWLEKAGVGINTSVKITVSQGCLVLTAE